MLFLPYFLKPKRNLCNLLRIHAGVHKNTNIKRLIKSVNVYQEPLQLVFLLATAISKYDKSYMTKQLSGVISHEYYSNAISMAAFQKFCKICNSENIPVLAIKGLVHKLLYPHSTRPMNDADFVVPKHVYRHAINIGCENGFHINHDMRYSADMQLGDQGCVDVHCAVFKGANPKMDDVIFNRARHINSLGCDVLIPIPEDIILIELCEFYGNFLYEAGSSDVDIRKIFASHPQWVLDVRKIICDNPDINWGEIMRTAQMSGYDYQIKIMMKLLNQIIPNSVPRHAIQVIDFMCPDYRVKQYLKRDKKIIYMHRKNYIIYKTNKQ